MPNPAVERDNQNAALFGSLRATRSGGRLCPTLNERPLFQTLSVAFGAIHDLGFFAFSAIPSQGCRSWLPLFSTNLKLT